MYLLNQHTKIAHILPSLERCNGDDIGRRRIEAEIPSGYRLCLWCQKRTATYTPTSSITFMDPVRFEYVMDDLKGGLP